MKKHVHHTPQAMDQKMSKSSPEAMTVGVIGLGMIGGKVAT
ncbi:hypothetical protein [Acetobacter syzygii]